MNQCRFLLRGLLVLLVFTLLWGRVGAAPPLAASQPASRLQKRWLFYWRSMNDPKEVARVIADFPRAKADGYNAVVFGYDVAPAKAAEFRQAAKKNGLGLGGNGHGRRA